MDETVKGVDLCNEELIRYVGGSVIYVQPIGDIEFRLDGEIIAIYLSEKGILKVDMLAKRNGEQDFSLFISLCQVMRKSNSNLNTADITIIRGIKESGHALTVSLYLPGNRQNPNRRSRPIQC